MSQSASAAPLVQLTGVVKAFPGVVAVDGVDLSFERGEITGLVGKNGAGKSTVIQILAGAMAPDEGTIEVEGQEVAHFNTRAAGLLGLSFVHQHVIGVPGLSVAENVQLGVGFPRRFGFVNWKELFKRSRGVLEGIGANIDPTAPFGALSVAQQRLVTIARAMTRRAKLVVLDEPTAALTDREIVHLFEVLRQLRSDGVGVLFVSHRLDEILDLCDRAVVMRDGRVVGDDVTQAMTRAQLIAKISGTGAARAAELDKRTRAGRIPGQVVLDVSDIGDGHRVHDVSFQLRAGEVLGIGGLTGSGRTELVRLLYGADRRLAGEVTVSGKRFDGASPRDALRAGIVLLPENRGAEGLHLDFSVTRNITLPSLRENRRFEALPMPSKKKERATAERLVRQLTIKTASPETPLRLLSGGNQQKVMLAKWLDHGAKVFLFDEPSQGVDVDGKEDIYRLMEELAALGRGVIFISSEFAELVEVCDRVLVMREGRVAGLLNKEEISSHAIVNLCYGE